MFILKDFWIFCSILLILFSFTTRIHLHELKWTIFEEINFTKDDFSKFLQHFWRWVKSFLPNLLVPTVMRQKKRPFWDGLRFASFCPIYFIFRGNIAEGLKFLYICRNFENLPTNEVFTKICEFWDVRIWPNLEGWPRKSNITKIHLIHIHRT